MRQEPSVAISTKYAATMLVAANTFFVALTAHDLLAQKAADAESAGKSVLPAQPKAADLAAQITFYAERLDEALAKGDAYDEGKQSRVEKDAVTVVALAGMLARHADSHDLKSKAAAIRAAAGEIAVSFREYAPSAAAMKRINEALSGKADSTTDSSTAAAADFKPDAAMLMKQIRFIDNRLKRAARDRSGSEKTRSEVAGHAATIAALADPLAKAANPHAKDAEQEQAWREQSAAMAEAATRLNAAAHDEKGAGIAEALRAVDATCVRCHADFR